MSIEHIEIYEGQDGGWYWRMRDRNGEIIASGEGYTSLDGCKDGVANVLDAANEIRIRCVHGKADEVIQEVSE